MSFRKKAKDDKYLRLTGLWPSKNNEMLFTGRLKAEQIEELAKRCDEALEGDAPIVMSLWENDKKKSKADPEFSLQCFVGDSEEQPRSSRGSSSSRRSSRHEEEEEEDTRTRGKSKRKPALDEEDDNQDDDNQDDPQEDEPEEEKPRKRSGTSRETTKKKKRADW